MTFRFLIITASLLFNITSSIAQDSTVLKVHFLYGSKPKKKFKHVESNWFGGILGGQVDIEVTPNKIINFVPSGSFHIIEQATAHGAFIKHDSLQFYSLFGNAPSEVKKVIVYIPISIQQKELYNSIIHHYTKQAPYDYAFIGKRCGSAAYDILSQLNILPQFSHQKTYFTIFYPRKLRNRLFKLAQEYDWRVIIEKGSARRIWEKDIKRK